MDPVTSFQSTPRPNFSKIFQNSSSWQNDENDERPCSSKLMTRRAALVAALFAGAALVALWPSPNPPCDAATVSLDPRFDPIALARAARGARGRGRAPPPAFTARTRAALVSNLAAQRARVDWGPLDRALRRGGAALDRGDRRLADGGRRLRAAARRAANHTCAWSGRLAAALRGTAVVRNYARRATTSFGAVALWMPALLAADPPPDLVVVDYGANDRAKARAATRSRTKLEAQLGALSPPLSPSLFRVSRARAADLKARADRGEASRARAARSRPRVAGSRRSRERGRPRRPSSPRSRAAPRETSRSPTRCARGAARARSTSSTRRRGSAGSTTRAEWPRARGRARRRTEMREWRRDSRSPRPPPAAARAPRAASAARAHARAARAKEARSRRRRRRRRVPRGAPASRSRPRAAELVYCRRLDRAL